MEGEILPDRQNSVPQSEPTNKKHKKKSKNKQRPPLPQDVDTCPVLDCIQINILHCTKSFYDICVDISNSFEEGQPSEDKQPTAEKGSSVGCADETAQSEGGTDSPLDTCTLFTKETDKNRPKKGRNRAEKGKGKANSEAADEHLLSLNSNNTREMVSGPVTNPEFKPRGNTNLDAVGSTVTLCETFSKATVGNSDKRSGPVPEKDCDKKEISTTLSVSVMAQDVTKTKPRGLRSCANCLLKEPSPFFYQKCRLCKTQKMKLVRFYCSRECQGRTSVPRLGNSTFSVTRHTYANTVVGANRRNPRSFNCITSQFVCVTQVEQSCCGVFTSDEFWHTGKPYIRLNMLNTPPRPPRTDSILSLANTSRNKSSISDAPPVHVEGHWGSDIFGGPSLYLNCARCLEETAYGTSYLRRIKNSKAQETFLRQNAEKLIVQYDVAQLEANDGVSKVGTTGNTFCWHLICFESANDVPTPLSGSFPESPSEFSLEPTRETTECPDHHKYSLHRYFGETKNEKLAANHKEMDE
uniref:Uncharacterized protein n=1 Tax=Timema bartmani TaxID=61472 RepID=A0A7R9HZE1_9NEOP|nr:unnamed protein product [Timema bartmani]